MSSAVSRLFISCDAAARSVGADMIAELICREAEECGHEVDLVRTGSRGMLWLEPMIEVETKKGRVAYGPVQPCDIKSLLDNDMLNGGQHTLYHGLTEEIPFFANQERLTFARCGITAPLSLKDYEQHGGLTGLRNALNLTPKQIVTMVKDAGLRGRGGAGFPTGIKWQTALDAKSSEKYFCVNADEGDSGTYADRMLMEGDPFSLLEGMVIGARAVGANTGYIYIRSEYPDAIETMNKAVNIWKAANLLGPNIDGSDQAFDVIIRTGGGAYICGEETSMLESLEGKRGEVKVKPPIPAISGLFEKPTIINNVLTVASVPTILSRGSKFYRAYGQGRSRGTQAFQLAGDVECGGLVEKAFGVSLLDLIENFGGGTRSGAPIRAVQTGGPLGSYLNAGQLDIDMDYEALSAAGAMLGHGGVVVFNETVNMAAQARFAMAFCEVESCGKCTPCRLGSVRGKETLDQIISGENIAENLVLLEDLCETMENGSLCAMGGLTPMPVRSAIANFPEDFVPPNQNQKV